MSNKSDKDVKNVGLKLNLQTKLERTEKCILY